MNDVKRYNPEDWGGLCMMPSSEGAYVHVDDYERLRAENEALNQKLIYYRDFIEQMSYVGVLKEESKLIHGIESGEIKESGELMRETAIYGGSDE